MNWIVLALIVVSFLIITTIFFMPMGSISFTYGGQSYLRKRRGGFLDFQRCPVDNPVLKDRIEHKFQEVMVSQRSEFPILWPK